jgi:hypothetical protein
MEADLFECVMKHVPKGPIAKMVLLSTAQKIGVAVMGAELFTDRKIVFNLGGDVLLNRDKPVFTELGLFDENRSIIPSVMVS